MGENWLILVRHSVPVIDSARPAKLWRLSEEGRARCLPLADALRAYRPAIVLASIELKAQETAALLAESLHLPWQTADGLHEHERPNTPFFPTLDEFRSAIATFFRHPDILIFGAETASQTLTRFQAALAHILPQHPAQTVLIVSHGTVMALFLAHQTGGDAFEIWQNLQMPDFVALPLISL
ncbi:MAG: histidine phosphatase family protein [Anaerolineales bacterium]|nr:histidine phosphatase family protein [Anaerolineales bacterium]